MLDPKSLKRRIEYRENQKLIEEGFIEPNNPNPEDIKLKKVYESNGNYHNKITLKTEENSANKGIEKISFHYQ